jgi:hypothetical protein
MKSLRVIQAKPNPTGKDRQGNHAPPAQLAAEWVDFMNDGNEVFPLTGVSLQHLAYQPRCREPKSEFIMNFSGELLVGKVVRVHSGGKIALADMHPQDAVGADFHLFTGKNYV